MSGYKGYGGYQSSGASDSTNEFTRLSNSIGSNIQKISQNVSSMQRMVNQMDPSQDSEQQRAQLHQLQHYTNQLAKDTNSSLKELSQLPQSLNPSDSKQRRMVRDRLTSDFSEVLKNFQVIQRTAAQKEKESMSRARSHSKHSQSDEPSALIDIPGDSGSTPFASQKQIQQQQQLQMEEEINIEEWKEREKSIRQIESDIVDVNKIFKDLATMIHAQGELIDSIEANVESATIQVTEGAQQISKARDYQGRARRKMVCLIAVFASVLGIIALIILLSNK